MKFSTRFGLSGRLQPSSAALAVATLLATSVAQAAPTAEDLQKTRLYGNVSIAQDSLADWGPWSAFEAPAAGLDVFQGLPEAATEVYRPLAQGSSGNAAPVDPLGLTCAGGSICGFGVFADNSEGGKRALRIGGNDSMAADQHPFMMTGVVNTPGGEGGRVSDVLPQNISLNTTALSTGTVAPALVQMNNLPMSFYEYTYYQSDEVYGTDVKYMHTTGGEDAGSSTGIGMWIYTGDEEWTQALAQTQLVDMNGGDWVWAYINGTNNQEGYTQQSGQSLYGVIGFSTPDADMAALRASGATASYSGYMQGNAWGQVNVNVQFGSGNWQGSWNGGADGGYTYTRSTASGGTMLGGNVGFHASGTLNGSNFTSNKVWADDGAVSAGSFVKGAFYGPNANAVGGVYDVTKTVAPVTAPVTTPVMPALPTAPIMTEVSVPVAVPAAAPTEVVVRPGYTDARAVGSFKAFRPEFANVLNND